MKQKKCIICEFKIEPSKTIEKYEVYFCSENCVEIYEIKLKELNGKIDWDKCC
jgi:predicted nucleic acid-binding Zn ribbon protein